MIFNNYNLDTLFAEELEIDFAKDSIYSEKLVTFSNSEGRIKGTKLKSNSDFTFFSFQMFLRAMLIIIFSNGKFKEMEQTF